MTKKILCTILVFVIAVPCFNLKAIAYDIIPFYLYTESCSSLLTISGTTATCTSKATGYLGETTKIVIDQILEQKSSGDTWSYVNSWNETYTGHKSSATNYEYSLSKGKTYRLRTVFTVYCGTKYETIEKTSKEVTA